MIKVYYENGQIVKTVPNIGEPYYEHRELINAAVHIVSDGVEFDLSNIDSIAAIAVPTYTHKHPSKHAQELGVTGHLDYVLRMHAGLLWAQKEYTLAIACLEKAIQLMLCSTIAWGAKDFYRIVDWNIELREFRKAKEWKDWIEKTIPSSDDVHQDALNRTINSCLSLETDLVEVGDIGACCEICAMYRKRIYSLSGESRKFPKFPDRFHFGCGLGIYPFVEGVMEPTFPAKNYVHYSQRPFCDDRTEEEKADYRKRFGMLKQMEYKEHQAKLNRIVWYWLQPIFPNIFPKSLSAFSRMKKANTEKYKQLVAIIENAGYIIPESLEDVILWEEKQNT